VAHYRAMRITLLLSLLLAGCGSANRTDGVTSSEAASLNAAADKLDAPPTEQAPPKPN
jgi:outer membrane murein-binding lipoprotein Lpp